MENKEVNTENGTGQAFHTSNEGFLNEVYSNLMTEAQNETGKTNNDDVEPKTDQKEGEQNETAETNHDAGELSKGIKDRLQRANKQRDTAKAENAFLKQRIAQLESTREQLGDVFIPDRNQYENQEQYNRDFEKYIKSTQIATNLDTNIYVDRQTLQELENNDVMQTQEVVLNWAKDVCTDLKNSKAITEKDVLTVDLWKDPITTLHLIQEEENSSKILQTLLKYPDYAQKVSNLEPLKQAKEIARISLELGSEVNQKSSETVEKRETPKPVQNKISTPSKNQSEIHMEMLRKVQRGQSPF